jgi:hypothetical protein
MGTERAVEVARILQPQGVMVYFIAAGEGDGYKVYYSHSLAPMLNTTEGFIAIK